MQPETFSPRFIIDGAIADHPDADLASDGTFPPFFIFDSLLQRNIAGPYPTREAAKQAHPEAV